MELEEVRKNTHQQHIESLVMFGEDGLGEINYKLKNYIDSIDDNNNNLNVTTKIDGAPAVQIYSHIGQGYPDNGIGLKSLVSDPKNAITSEEQIEGKYSDRPNMAAMLMFCLDLAHCIPRGEIWQGDCLFTSNTKKEVELNGKSCIIFQPNKVVYSFSEDNPNYEKIKNANFGICFHTIYKKSSIGVSQSFRVDPERLSNVPNDVYVMSPAVNKSSVGFDVKVNKELFTELNELEKKLLGNSYYNDLCSNEVFMKYWQMFENHITSDKASTKIDPKTFYDELKEFVEEKMKNEFDSKISKLKTDKGKARAEQNYLMALEELQYLLEQHKDILLDCVKVFNKVVDIKMNIFNHLKNSPRDYDSYLYKATGEYEPTSGEGFSMSDQDGNIVKLVDRSEFAHANRSKDYLSGFEHESYDPKNMVNTVSNTDKDPSVIATKEYHKMKTKKLKPGQMIVSMGEAYDHSDNKEMVIKAAEDFINHGNYLDKKYKDYYIKTINPPEEEGYVKLYCYWSPENDYDVNSDLEKTSDLCDKLKQELRNKLDIPVILKVIGDETIKISYPRNEKEFNKLSDISSLEILDEDKRPDDKKIYNLVYNKLLDLAENSMLKHKSEHKNYEVIKDYLMRQYRANKIGHTMLNKLNKLVDSYDNMVYEGLEDIGETSVVYRGESSSRYVNEHKNEYGLFFTKYKGVASEYGDGKIVRYEMDANINLCNDYESSYDCCVKNNLEHGERFDDWAINQKSAKDFLESKGYDGAVWLYEDRMCPYQFQIWNLDMVDRIGEVNSSDESLQEKIVKKGTQWQVQSEKGKNMGTYDTKEEAKKKLGQVEYFKRKNEDIVWYPKEEDKERLLDLRDLDDLGEGYSSFEDLDD